MSRPVKANNRKKGAPEFDYTYGEEDKGTLLPKEGQPNADESSSDELIVGSKKKMEETTQKEADLDRRAKEFQKAKEEKQKYLSYSDFVNNDDYETNGYKYDKDDDFAKMDVSGWSLMIGFILIRVVSPLILILHGIVIGLVLWKVYEFDFSVESPLVKTNSMPWVTGALSVNAFVVHWLSKFLFKNNYYKPRVKK